MAAKNLGNVYDDRENERGKERLNMAAKNLGNVHGDPNIKQERKPKEIEELERTEEDRKNEIAQLKQEENLKNLSSEGQMRLKELQADQKMLDEYRAKGK